MGNSMTQSEKIRRGSEDSGRYFRYMTEFVGFTEADKQAIKESGLVIEKHIPNIVSAFYTHLLRYPPTRKYFLLKDGSIDQDYLQKRMHHLTNFWRRTTAGLFDDEYARYVDYVGRAHTSHGADPNIYIAERYVIGQVGFMQHAITKALNDELHEYDPELEHRAIRAWNLLMMVILEMLSRAYGTEREAETFGTLQTVDHTSVQQLAVDTYEAGLGLTRPVPQHDVRVARISEIPDGERKIVQIDDVSIGVFHHQGQWYAVRNHCLHRGGPVATGCLTGDVLECPWHGFRYNVTNGELLVDPGVKLDMYPVILMDDEIYLRVPVKETGTGASEAKSQSGTAVEVTESESGEGISTQTRELPALSPNQFLLNQISPGTTGLVAVAEELVVVYNIDGAYYATQNTCTHAGGPLNEGELDGSMVVCPWHASCFDVTNGKVLCGPAKFPLKTYKVSVSGEIGSVE